MQQIASQIFPAITRRCFINAPFDQLRQGLTEIFVRHGLRPEIGLEGDCLWELDRSDFEKTADLLRRNGLACTLHAPFSDLAPGARDPRILEISREKLRRAFALIPVFRPQSIVCHLGYDEYKHSYTFDGWLRASLATWNELLDKAGRSGTPVMFENTYEPGPHIHRSLFDRLSARGQGKKPVSQ